MNDAAVKRFVLKSQASRSPCYQRAVPGSPTIWIIFFLTLEFSAHLTVLFSPSENIISVHLICSPFCFLIICKTCCVPLHPFLTLYNFIEEVENEKSRCVSSYQSAQVQFSSFSLLKIFLIINRSWLQFTGKWIQNMMINVRRIIS